MSGGDLGASITEFLAMGGHGLYVWMSYAAALGVVLYNQLAVRSRERRWVREYLDRERRHAGARAPVGLPMGSSEGVVKS